MADAPKGADHSGVLDATLAANDCGDGDNVIGVGGMAHPEKEAKHDNGEKSDHRLIKRLRRRVRRDRLFLKIRVRLLPLPIPPKQFVQAEREILTHSQELRSSGSRLAGRPREFVMTASREAHVLRAASPAIRHQACRPGKHKFHMLGCESVQSLVPLASFVLFALLLERLSHPLLGSFSSPIQSASLTSMIFQAAQKR